MTANTKQKLIELKNITVSYNGHCALNSLSLTIYDKEHIALRGGNGAGKSTLLRLLRGEQWPDQVFPAPTDPPIIWYPEKGKPEFSPLVGRRMASLVSAAQQERALSQVWNVKGENLILGGLTDAIYVLYDAEGPDKARIEELASSLNIEFLLERRVPELSQGQLRALLIARALMQKPSLLLLDEVSDGLDKSARTRLFDLLEKVAESTTLIVSTHRPETLPSWIQREVCMAHGSLISDSDFNTISKPKEHFSSAIKFPPKLRTLFKSTGKQEFANKENRLDNVLEKACIEIVNADIYIERAKVLHNINWTLKAHEHWAICGENGSGKSTLLRLLAGDEYPAEKGFIRRVLPSQGGEVTSLEDIRRGVHLVSDLQQALYPYDITGEELVLSGIDNSIGLYREIEEEERELAEYNMLLLGVGHLATRNIRSCSTGELRRLLLARAFMTRPDFLLLDEPCSGLDPESREHIFNILQEFASEGTQIIYISHYAKDIPDFITHSLSLKDGSIEEIRILNEN